MIENLLDSPILYSLALTLLHFLWQGCLIALVLKCLLSITSYKKPQLRYLWAAIALIVCLISPIATFSLIYTPNYLHTIEQGLNSVAALDSTQSIAVINSNWYQIVVDSLPFLSLAWMATVLLLSINLLFALKQVNQLATTDTIAVNQTLQTKFQRLVSQFTLWRKPQLLISLKTEVPMAIGWLKPVILLPAAMISGLTSAQLEMLILHELAHIKRHDYLVNFLQTIAEILLFFHPGVRWISKQMRNEREYCSDDIAVKHCGNAIAYAHTLADTASLCHKHRHSSIPTMAVAASGGDLKQRVIRLIDQEHTCTAENDSGKLLASVVILFAISSVFAKPFIDNRIIDWGAGRISLMQSAGELLQHRVSNDELPLSQTSIAQQLVEQNTTISDDVIEPNIDTLAEVQVKNTVATQAQKQIANTQAKLDKTTNKIVKAVPKKVIIPANKETSNTLATKVIPSAKHNTGPILAAKPAPKISQLAQPLLNLSSEGAISKNSEKKFSNPYAAQVASLTEDPLPSSDQLINFERKLGQTQPVNHGLVAERNQQTINNNYNQILAKSTSAKLISSVEPRYPSVAKRKGIEVDVLVTFVINKDGVVSDIEFEDKNKVSYFRAAVRTAMNKWHFVPAKINDKPVESKMAKIFSFSLIES